MNLDERYLSGNQEPQTSTTEVCATRYSAARLLTAFKRRKSEERDLRYIAKLFAPCWSAALRRVRQTRQVA